MTLPYDQIPKDRRTMGDSDLWVGLANCRMLNAISA